MSDLERRLRRVGALLEEAADRRPLPTHSIPTIAVEPAPRPHRTRTSRALLLGLAVVIVVVVTVAVLIVATDSPGPTRPHVPANLSVRALYHRLERAITRPGSVYHQTETLSSAQSPVQRQTMDVWVDAARGLARRQYREPPPVAEIMSNGRGHGATKTDSFDIGKVPSCYGTSPALSMIVTCSSKQPSLNATQRVTTGSRDGRPAVVLITRTKPDLKAGGPVPTQARLYLDAKTLLPVAATSTQYAPIAIGDGDKIETRTYAIHSTSTYRHEFVSARNLPDDFFTPESIEAWAHAR